MLATIRIQERPGQRHIHHNLGARRVWPLYWASGWCCISCCWCSRATCCRLWRWCLARRQCSELLHIDILHVGAQHVLRAMLARHTAENHTVEKRVSSEAVVTMHTAGALTSNVQARHRPILADDCGVDVGLEAAHAVVNHGRDDRHVERL